MVLDRKSILLTVSCQVPFILVSFRKSDIGVYFFNLHVVGSETVPLDTAGQTMVGILFEFAEYLTL